MATELKAKENLYQEGFQARQESRGPESSWLDRLRQNAMERFAEVGFPSVKEEEWKYTNVAAIALSNFAAATTSKEAKQSDAELKQLDSVPEAGSSQLVFVDGMLRSDLSSLGAVSDQVVAIDLAQALADERYSDIARAQLSRQADYVVNGFTALNTAFIDHGAFVYVPKD